jgi:hypothetical protein
MTLGVSGALQQEARPAREGRASPALGGWRRQSVQVPPLSEPAIGWVRSDKRIGMWQP